MSAITSCWRDLLAVAEETNPVLLIGLMTILPLVGVPISPFWVLSGLRFGPAIGFVVAVASLSANFTVAYWLAQRWLRAPLSRWLQRRGYRILTVNNEDEVQLILMIRLAPGLPLFVQNYLLGLASVKFSRYLYCSLPVQAAYCFLFVFLGHSLLLGHILKVAAGGATLLVAGLATSLVRRQFRRSRAAHERAGNSR